jgi:hypothetical protein
MNKIIEINKINIRVWDDGRIDRVYGLEFKNLKGTAHIQLCGKYKQHQTCINGRLYTTSRLVAAAWHGLDITESPKLIDHINGDSLDNRAINLRIATHAQNSQNRKNVKGFQKMGKLFYAKISVDNKIMNLGSFGTEEEAATAYREAKIKYHNIGLMEAIENNIKSFV